MTSKHIFGFFPLPLFLQFTLPITFPSKMQQAKTCSSISCVRLGVSRWMMMTIITVINNNNNNNNNNSNNNNNNNNNNNKFYLILLSMKYFFIFSIKPIQFQSLTISYNWFRFWLVNILLQKLDTSSKKEMKKINNKKPWWKTTAKNTTRPTNLWCNMLQTLEIQRKYRWYEIANVTHWTSYFK